MPEEVNPNLQQHDHDLLVRIDTQMKGLLIEIKQANSELNTKVQDHEGRIRDLEKTNERVQPVNLAAETLALGRWKIEVESQFKAAVKTSAAIGASVSGLITVVGALIAIYFAFHH